MKRIKMIAQITSSIIFAQSIIMFVMLLWFNRFSTDVYYKIPDIHHRIFVLYIGALIGAALVYTAKFYDKPGLVAASFFTLVGLVMLVNGITASDNVFIMIYLAVFGVVNVFCGVCGYYYRLVARPNQTKK